MPSLIDCAKDFSDDNTYSAWMCSNTEAICQELIQGTQDHGKLLDRITTLALDHHRAPNNSAVRLEADIGLLKRVIAAKQSNDSKGRVIAQQAPTKYIWDKKMRFVFKSDDSEMQRAQDALHTLEQCLQHQLRKPITQHSIPAATCFTPRKIALAFTLLNTDFMSFDLTDYPATSIDALELMIGLLKATREKLPSEAQAQVDRLLSKFQSAYDLSVWLTNIARQCPTTPLFHQAEQIVKNELMMRLKSGETLYLSSGWVAHPEGHHITIELTPTLTAANTITVTGRIQNRGAGISRHECFVKGTKIAYDPELTLMQTPLDDLGNSAFFSDFLQLLFIARPRDPDIPKERDTPLPTVFGKQDFFDVLLRSWPGGVSFTQEPKPRISQRGSTCSIKPLITEMKDLLGRKHGELAKFYLTKCVWEMFITHLGVTHDYVDQIQPLLKKFALRAQKLKMSSQLEEDATLTQEINHVLLFCAEVEETVRSVKKNREEQCFAQKTPVSNPVKEKALYHLNLPVMAPPPAIGQTKAGEIKSEPLDQPLEMNRVHEWTTNLLARANTAMERGLPIEAQNILIYALRALPNPNDDAWLTVTHSTDFLKNTDRMLQMLCSMTVGPKDRELLISPQQACLWIKLFGITYRLTNKILPPDLRYYYADGMQHLVVRQQHSLFCPLHPRDLSGFRATQALIQDDARLSKKINILKRSACLPQNNWCFICSSTDIEDLTDIQSSNPELTYLYQISRTMNQTWQDQSKSMIGSRARGGASEDNIAIMSVLRAYKWDGQSSDPIIQQIPFEYYALRNAFTYSCLALTYRGRYTSAEPAVLFYDARFSKDSSSCARTSVEFLGLGPNNSEGLDVFADLFSGFDSKTADKNTAWFILRSLSGVTEDKPYLFHHNDLIHLHKPASLMIEGQAHSLDAFELQDLIAINTQGAPRLLQFTHYFKKHLSCLNKGLFQSLFLGLLFKATRIVCLKGNSSFETPLETALAHLPRSREVDIFFSFLAKSIQQMRKAKNWEIYCFLMYAYAISLSHCVHAVGPIAPINTFIATFEEELKTMTKVAGGLAVRDSAIFGYYLPAMIGYLSDNPCLIPLIQIIQPFLTNLDSADAGYIPSHHLLEDKWAGLFQLKYQRHLSDPAVGRRPKQTLPDDIYEHRLYRKIFGSRNFPVQILSPGYYTFVDDNNITYRVQANPLHFFCQFPNSQDPAAWYVLQETDLFANPGQDRDHPCFQGGYLNNDTRVWFKTGKTQEAYVLNPAGEILCRVLPNAIVHPTSPKVLLANYHQPVIDTLARLIPKTSILAWKDGATGLLSTIELKEEFNLCFEAKTNQAETVVQWNCAQYQGYFIDVHQKSPSFEPFPHYIVLTNAKGQRKVVIPSRRYSPKKIPFAKRETPEMHNDTVKKLFSYDLNDQGLVSLPSDPETSLYLLYLALEKQDYSLGFNVLKNMRRHPENWNHLNMGEILSYFDLPDANNRDLWNSQPQAMALRLQLHSLMLSQSSVKMSDTQKDLTLDDYLVYLEQLHNVPAEHQLSHQDERRLYDTLVELTVSPQTCAVFNNRMRMLERQGITFSEEMEFKSSSATDDQPLLTLSPEWSWIDPAMQSEMIAALDRPKPIHFPMRPGAAFLYNFLYYYNVLQESSSHFAKHIVTRCLEACRNDRDPRIQCARTLLLAVSQTPNSFLQCSQLRKGYLAQLLREMVEKRGGRDRIVEPSSFHKALQVDEIRRNAITELPAARILEPTLPQQTVFTPLTIGDIPDTLLQELLDQRMITQSSPSDQDVVKLQEDLQQLHELAQCYEKMAKSSNNPVTVSEFSRILVGIRDVIHATTQTLVKTQQLVGVDVSQLDTDQKVLCLVDSALNKTISDLRTKRQVAMIRLKKREKQICDRLQRYDSPELELQMRAGLLPPLTFEEALVALGRGDDTPFYRANPGLRPNEFLEIKEEICLYLLYKLNVQKCVRLLDGLKQVRKLKKKHGIHSTEYAVASKHVIETLRATRVYTPREAPHLLVFEAFADISLRKEQLIALEQLTHEDAGNVVFEARTGFGKSKTLIPLWLHLTAKQRRSEPNPGFAMMTVPSSLYPQEVIHLKSVLGDGFHQAVYAFTFDREKANDLNFLKQLNHLFNQAAQEGMCALTTIHSLHGLVDLKIEELLTLNATKVNDALLDELRLLRFKIRYRLSNFIDESRECLEIRTDYDYAIGIPNAVPEIHCQAVEVLYQILLELNLPFDFLPGEIVQNARPLTEAHYHAQIKGILADRLLERLIPGTLPEPEPFLNHQLLRSHLMGNYDSAVDAYLDKIPVQARRQYAIYRLQLNRYLPRTLTRPCNGRFGLVPKKTGNRFAYPFERGVPKLSSQFATIDDLLNFTTQGNLKTPFSIPELQEFIQSLKLRFVQAKNSTHFVEKDPEYQNYLTITQGIKNWPENIVDCQPQDIELLHRSMQNPERWRSTLKFITRQILPKITVYPKKVSSTAHNVAGAMQKLYGSSATVNTDTHPLGLKTIEYPSTLIGSLLALWKNSQKAIYRLNSPNARELLLSTLAKHSEYRIIIDVANSFGDLRDEKEIARMIFEQTERADPPVDAVSYYNEAGENRVFLRPKPGEEVGNSILRNQCKISVDNIFIFMRQSAAVGSDTPMPMTGKALVTVDGTTQRDLFFQGIGRMRGITNGQRIGFLIQEKDAATFQNENGEVTLSKILEVVSGNQGEQRGQDLVFNLRLLLQNLVKEQWWSYFDDHTHSLFQCRQLSQALEGFLVENTMEDPLDSLKQSLGIVPIQQAVEQIKNSFVRRLTPIITPEIAKIINLDASIARFNTLIHYDRLPQTANMGGAEDYDRDVAVAVEAESAQAEEEGLTAAAENENQLDTALSLPRINFDFFPPTKLEHYSTWVRTEPKPYSETAASQFPKQFSESLAGIYGTDNFSLTSYRSLPEGAIKTAYQYLIIREKDMFKVVLMDLFDTTAMLQESKDSGDRDYYLMSSDDELITEDASRPLSSTNWAKQPQLTLMVKIFTRNWHFTEHEIRHLVSLDKTTRDRYIAIFTYVAQCWPIVSHHLSSLIKRCRQ